MNKYVLLPSFALQNSDIKLTVYLLRFSSIFARICKYFFNEFSTFCPPNKYFDWALDLWTFSELSKRWSATTTFATARSFWARMNHKRSSELLALSKVNHAAIVGVLTGHCPIGLHPVWLSNLSLCQSCMAEGGLE